MEAVEVVELEVIGRVHPPSAASGLPPQCAVGGVPVELVTEGVVQDGGEGNSEKPQTCSLDNMDTEKAGDPPSPAFLHIPTGPANGFFWEPAVDGPSMPDPSCFLLETEGAPSIGIVRPFIIGSLVGCLAAATYQVFVFKPVYASVSSPFLVLLVYVMGLGWEWAFPCTPRRAFGVQEHAVAAMIAISAAKGNLAVQTFAVQKLYYTEAPVNWMTATLGIFATTGFGVGVAGLFDVYATWSPDLVFPVTLPVLSLLRELHHSPSSSHSTANFSPVRLFGYSFGAAFLYEVLPGYIAPLLTGVSVFCLSTQHAAREVRRTFTDLFGGASGNEGLGLFGVSLDWQFISASSVELPLVYQVNVWAGYLLCYGAVMGLYYSNTWRATEFPMIATTLFNTEGGIYNQSAILDARLTVDPGLLKEAGLPNLASSAIWTSITGNIASGSLITHIGLFVGVRAVWPFVSSRSENGKSVEKQQAPWNTPPWWYIILIFLAFFSGMTVVLRQHLHLSTPSLLIAHVLGVIAIPAATAIYGHLGVEFVSQHATKVVAAAILPGRPLDILYFSMWSNSAIAVSIFATSQARIGSLLKIPTRVTFVAMLWGLVLGGLVNNGVMESIVGNQAVMLVKASGLHIWSGQLMQTMNSEAFTWALAKELYTVRRSYGILPFSFLFGAVLSGGQYALHKMFPRAQIFNGNVTMLPVVFMASSMMTYGNTSSVLSTVIVAILCQGWLAKAHQKLFRATAATVGAALDGGTQSMVLVLSLSVLGALGRYKPFFEWAGNNLGGNVDYCDPL